MKLFYPFAFELAIWVEINGGIIASVFHFTDSLGRLVVLFGVFSYAALAVFEMAHLTKTF